MSIDILLTYPSDGFRAFSSMIPIGLASIGTVLKNHGYEVKIVDFNHYCDDFRKDLRQWKPRVIGIGGTTPTRMGSFLTARLAKEVLPETPVVYGGVNATFTAQEALRNIPQIGYCIAGEGEFSFLRLCDSVFGKNPVPLEEISGLAYRSNDSVVVNKPERIDNLSILPIPDRTLFPYNYKTRMEFLDGDGDFIITSRGCPAACNFCAASRMFPGGVRFRGMDLIAAEIELLKSKRKFDGLKIFDSTFTASKKHVYAFCEMIKGFNLKWECEVRADTVDFDLLSKMKESGCYYINIGMETANPKHLRRIAKGITPEQVLTVLDTCKRIGIRSKVFFTFGHFGQTFKECIDDVRFIKNTREKIDFFAVTVGMRLYPGTALEKLCRKENLLPRNFSWTSSSKSIGNLFVFESGDVPVLFQKTLRPYHLSLILFYLLINGLLCTKDFLAATTISNIGIVIRSVIKNIRYTKHRIIRKVVSSESRV